MLLSIARYIDLAFEPESRPTRRTVEKWIAESKLPDSHKLVRFGKRAFIDVPAETLPPSVLATIEEEERQHKRAQVE